MDGKMSVVEEEIRRRGREGQSMCFSCSTA